MSNKKDASKMKPYKILESWNVEEPPKVEENIYLLKFDEVYGIIPNYTSSYTIEELINDSIGKDFLEELYKDYFYKHFYEWIKL